LETLLTGAIHLDGLADTADGLGAPRERALDVMREPAVGAFGVCAIGLALLAKTAALAAVVAGPDAFLAVTVAYAVGRGAPCALALALPYARREGPGGVLSARAARPWLLVGLALAALLALVLGLRGVALLAGGAAGAALAVFPAIRLRGVTGDVLGAAAELATIGALVAAAATR
jgi:adenosylcobinamide-GDP ribazoletransferase